MSDQWTKKFMRKASMIIAMQQTDKHNSAVKPIDDLLARIDQLQGKDAADQEILDWRETFICARQSIRNAKRLKRQMQN